MKERKDASQAAAQQTLDEAEEHQKEDLKKNLMKERFAFHQLTCCKCDAELWIHVKVRLMDYPIETCLACGHTRGICMEYKYKEPEKKWVE